MGVAAVRSRPPVEPGHVMTPGFWLIVSIGALVLAVFLTWLSDRLADAYLALKARRAAALAEDAAVFDPPTERPTR